MHVVEITDSEAAVNVNNGCLSITVNDAEFGRVPLAELSVVLLSSPRAMCSVSAIASIAEQGATVVVCDPSMRPTGMVLPFSGHSEIGRRIQAQCSASLPLKKRLWKQVIQSKILGQAEVLEEETGEDFGLKSLVSKVRSGDVGNIEARAARRYWGKLLGRDFRRRRGEGVANCMLDYGYTVLRASIARCLCVYGLHPSLGIHHRHRANAFALADDLIEPFRPAIDRQVVCALKKFPSVDGLTPAVKKELVAGLRATVPFEGFSRTVEEAAKRSAASLAGAFLGDEGKLSLPWKG